MTRARALIDGWPGETRAAVLAADETGAEALSDLLILRADRPSYTGNLYLGRVQGLDRGLNAAFVEIGLARPGLLPLKAAQEAVHEGAALAVRVVREPSPGKGAKLAAAPAASVPADACPPALLAEATPLADLLRRNDPREIVVEGADRRQALAAAAPDLAPRLRGHTGPRPLFDSHDLEAAIDALLTPEVDLIGGGQLLIEPVRTLTAIDVDAGRADARGGRARQALDVDLAAAREIGRQIKLRALSGLIVVDFLELDTKAARQRVTQALQDALAGDPAGLSVSPMRASGLVEIARQRLRPPLHELLSEPAGRAGRVPDPVTQAYTLLRRAWSEALANPGRRPVLAAHPEVLEQLDGPLAQAHAALARALGHAPGRESDPARARTSCEILLL